ncbi:uncharacterized protein MONBRDRAFT_30543 [Monosiga brevicollis MX1]|uniref:Phospho-2-dehydro-3-deoxyheptonate aldolase n=1 Tax=Monosiga brevicollis TaxID=81824 RepID=A9VE96_MONBE|nr:uncharacterized protein MONBRDRAFT_30543 [Monosiga brevicollis MX1]EDQ84149.1 predicted protein [Monosiga brevicollis MX1]|eukprot:XP_001751044.1 hypothetical protein [Monosiga brevicollis MX1]
MAEPAAKRALTEANDQGNGVEKSLDAAAATTWSPTSWRSFPIQQQPEYEDMPQLKQVCDDISRLPPIVQPAEIDRLKAQLGEVAAGRRFILQGGDCAERFMDCTPDRIEAKLKILLQMSLVMVWGARVPLVRIGRIAGQYMKPRSQALEKVDGQDVYTYKGDSINSFDLSARQPDPNRLREAFFYSTSTMNYVRSLLSSGFADLHHPDTWDLSFVKVGDKRKIYEDVIAVGPTTVISELIDLVRKINPTDEPGRITLITRFGHDKVQELLPPVIRAIKAANITVAWECDPMHGNTRKADGGIKTRSFDHILKELLTTFDVHRDEQSWLGGIHFELTGDDVTECTGGSTGLRDADLAANYESFCDPRLNCHQSLEMAFLMAERLKQVRHHST